MPDELIGKYIGKYEVLRLIGRGGMAAVDQARDRVHNRVVALKVPSRELLGEKGIIERFEIEGRAACQISHENVVMTYEAGRDNAQCFIAMEFLRGFQLSRIISREYQLDVGQALEIARQVTLALTEIHGNSIHHRDIKPGNLMLDETGQVKLMDFGVAVLQQKCLTGAKGSDSDGHWIGTPVYLAPEQCLDLPTDHRTDIYALGIVLFEMIAGTLPYDPSDKRRLRQMILDEPIPPLRLHNPSATPAVERIIERATAKRAEGRYKSAKQMHQDILRALTEWESQTGERVSLKPLATATEGAKPRPAVLGPAAAKSRSLKISWLRLSPVYRWGLFLTSQAIAISLLTLLVLYVLILIEPVEVRRFSSRAKEMNGLAFSPDGKTMFAGGTDGTLRKYDSVPAPPQKGIRIWTPVSRNGTEIKAHASGVLGVAVSADSRFLVSSGADMTLRIMNTKTEEATHILLPGYTVQRLDLDAAGEKILGACSDHKVRLWSLPSGRELRVLKGHESVVYAVTFSNDGSRALSGGADGALILWSVETGEVLRRWSAVHEIVSSIDFSPDGRRYLSAGRSANARGLMRVWDFSSGETLRTITIECGDILDARFSKDGRTILCGGFDGTFRVFNAETGVRIQEFPGHKGAILNVAVSPAGTHAVTTGNDGTARMWKLPAMDFVQEDRLTVSGFFQELSSRFSPAPSSAKVRSESSTARATLIRPDAR